ncbi:MAG: hypothetical protein M1830_005744, partial [Pleopsidium flavum]
MLRGSRARDNTIVVIAGEIHRVPAAKGMTFASHPNTKGERASEHFRPGEPRWRCVAVMLQPYLSRSAGMGLSLANPIGQKEQSGFAAGMDLIQNLDRSSLSGFHAWLEEHYHFRICLRCREDTSDQDLAVQSSNPPVLCLLLSDLGNLSAADSE